MKFKVVGKSLILTDYSHKITEGENSFDTVEIAIPRYHDECDLSTLSFRFSEISDNGETAAVQILHHTKCDEKYIYLKGAITSDFSAITGKVTFMLTGVNGENVVAKFQSDPFTVNDDISIASLPNETTAEQLFNQAQLEVQKAIDAAERAEKASLTPAPAEIYPATEAQLGGIKSGNDISIDENGIVTVNSVKGNALEKIDDIKSIIMPASHPNNYLIYDNAGKPSVMAAIPKFYLDEVIDGASHTVHPAFIINGVEQDIIYISKYQNIIENNRAYSLPMKTPAVNVDFDTAYNYCKNKGTGWHLMTNAEWAAIALWCKKNSTLPKGNNNFGKDISETNMPQSAVSATRESNGIITKSLTGSGNESWYHNGTFAGIADLNGNVWHWNSGLRLVDGEIQIIENNNAADCNNNILSDNTIWKAILADGSLVSPGTLGTLKFERTDSSSAAEKFQLTDTFENSQITGNFIGRKPFRSVTAKNGIVVPNILKTLALFPTGLNDSVNDRFCFNNKNEQLPVRGGRWDYKDEAGVFCIDLDNLRTHKSASIGFRCAYYGDI